MRPSASARAAAPINSLTTSLPCSTGSRPPASTPSAKSTTSPRLARPNPCNRTSRDGLQRRADRRPPRQSGEAHLVQQLVCGTVGWDDDYLADYAKEPRS